MGKKAVPPQPFQNDSDTPFRLQERFWKSKLKTPNLSLAFDSESIIWDTKVNKENGKLMGKCIGVECFKVELDDLGEIGELKWKGKGREVEEEKSFGIGFIGIEGLVFIPKILSPLLQKSLIKESFHATCSPNLTSLHPHFSLPPIGLWPTILSGNSNLMLKRIDKNGVGLPGRRCTVNLEPITKENFDQVGERGKEGLGLVIPSKKNLEGLEMSVYEVFNQLRWVTLGWQYDWYSKTYLLNREKELLPPLINSCCEDLVKSIPWSKIYTNSEEESKDYKNWKLNYSCEAGVINFYHLNDSLTAHIDQSETDTIRPLVSFSLGSSAIFLIGGITRDIKPIPILLRSGDGLIMSGKNGRRIFHGLPRVLGNTLPDYLKSNFIDLNSNEFESEEEMKEWNYCTKFLEQGIRINLNVRQVFNSIGDKLLL